MSFSGCPGGFTPPGGHPSAGAYRGWQNGVSAPAPAHNIGAMHSGGGNHAFQAGAFTPPASFAQGGQVPAVQTTGQDARSKQEVMNNALDMVGRVYRYRQQKHGLRPGPQQQQEPPQLAQPIDTGDTDQYNPPQQQDNNSYKGGGLVEDSCRGPLQVCNNDDSNKNSDTSTPPDPSVASSSPPPVEGGTDNTSASSSPPAGDTSGGGSAGGGGGDAPPDKNSVGGE